MPTDNTFLNNKSRFEKTPIVFEELIVPNGFLDDYLESHALWYYYLCARKTYEDKIENPIVLEGEDDPTVDFKRLFKTIAFLYDVNPEHMVNCWPQIDMQCQALNLPQLPKESRYRFSEIQKIAGQ